MALGAERVETRPGGVVFHGPEALGMRACLWLRTAMRVFWVLAEQLPAQSAEELYASVRALHWPDHLSRDRSFAVEATLRGASAGQNARFLALKVKDAIADAMRDRLGARPDVDPRRPDVKVVVHLTGPRAAVYLDLAGRPLNQRGYRVRETEAPLKETLAAAVVLASGWDRRAPLCDPMCGSGTIAIEAAWLAMDRAPGLGRSFGFERWPSFGLAEQRVLADLREEAAARALSRPPGPILASDWHPNSVAAARENVRAAGLAQIVAPVHLDARILPPLSPPGFILCNPPYGERLGRERRLQLAGLYRALGERWSGFFGHTIAVLAGSPDFEREFGMEPVSRRELWNGPLRCALLVYKVGAALRDQASSG